MAKGPNKSTQTFKKTKRPTAVLTKSIAELSNNRLQEELRANTKALNVAPESQYFLEVKELLLTEIKKREK